MEKNSIVIPVYNSEPCLADLAQQISATLTSGAYEIIFINDMSTDNSWKKIEELAQQNENITGINLRKNSGQDNAIMAGLQQASGEYIIIMDDDLQHSPSDIPTLIEGCKSGADVCYAKFIDVKYPFWKRLGSWFNGKVAEIVIDKPQGLYISPFKSIKREIVEELLEYKGAFPYIDGLIFSLTHHITQKEIENHERFKGGSGYSLTKSISVWLKLATGFSVIPLRFATVIGFIIACASFVLGCFFLIRYFIFIDERVPGWPSLILIVLFLGGITMIFLGVIGEYIGRMYLKLNNFPLYSIKNKIKGRNK